MRKREGEGMPCDRAKDLIRIMGRSFCRMGMVKGEEMEARLIDYEGYILSVRIGHGKFEN